MPKILINEVDETSAGTPGRYGNYSVLITGYQKEYTAEEISKAQLDIKDYDEKAYKKANGEDVIIPELTGVAKVLKARKEKAITDRAYEFNSVADFKDVTGYDEKTITRKDVVMHKNSAGEVTEYHYGNRMAYELLKLGYQVVYKVINSVADMVDFDNFWAIFKDKATYDFRFISHGLLETCYDAAKHTKYYTRLAEINEAISELAKIEAKAEADVKKDASLDYLTLCKSYFNDLILTYTGFIDNSGNAYKTYNLAAGLDTEGNAVEDSGLLHDKEIIEGYITEHNSKHITIDVFNQINGNIARLASYRVDAETGKEFTSGRGDCIALIELDEDVYCETGTQTTKPEELIIEGINRLSTDIGDEGAYCALTVPSVYYANGMKLPGAFHYLACFMSSLSSGFAEWYAAAGYNRGVSSYAIDHTSVKLGEIAINALEPRNIKADPNKVQPKFACNVIANFRGSYYLWGNRTAALLKDEAGGGDLTAKHFLNIRQLCTTIKKQLYVACRRFTFDPNSDTLWFNFVNAITPTLDAMKADQGIRDYKVVKVFTDKKATLKARVRIIPIEAVEDFDITISLEDSFGGVSVTAEG